jgi:hypothetical protein
MDTTSVGGRQLRVERVGEATCDSFGIPCRGASRSTARPPDHLRSAFGCGWMMF